LVISWWDLRAEAAARKRMALRVDPPAAPSGLILWSGLADQAAEELADLAARVMLH
jgi:hypothetical protein